MNLLITFAAFAVALGVLIVVHELGHYAVARLCGVKVLRFSVGFGRPLWKKAFGADRTEWAIAAFPLGGYVKMLDEHEGSVAAAERHRAFNRQSVWKRIAIVAAGPTANFLLAIAVYWGLFAHGVQEAKPIVAAPEPGTLAAASGLQRGETILAVNQEPVSGWQEVRWKLLQLAVEKQRAELRTSDPQGNLHVRILDLSRFDAGALEGDPLARMGLRLYRPELAPVIGKVLPGSVAESAGLAEHDRVLAANGAPVRDWDDLVEAVRSHPGTPLRLDIARGNARLVVTLRPETVPQPGASPIGRIGAAPWIDPEIVKERTTLVRYDIGTAFRLALARCWETSLFSLKVLGKMVIGEVSWRNLSGPVTIADYAGQSAQLGFGPYIAFLALISISLGVLNLLPIPLLDGGHLLYYLVEIAKGSPVSERTMELGQRFGLTVLLLLMAFAFYNDINRLLAG